jgi:hypothetical protein
MATLNSPGVDVTVIDESFYTPAEPGTTPLIVVATAENKTNAAGTGTALATTKAQAGKAFRVTSQRDLVDLFGVPFFEKTASGSPVHGGERNEYGLLAAYSYLGVSNSAFIVRADVDLGQLEPAAAAPGAEPRDGQWWVDTQATAWGIQEWDARARSVGGQKFTTKTPIILDSDNAAKIDSGAPKASVGVPGDYAVVLTSDADAGYFYKKADNTWTKIGSPGWTESWPTIEGSVVSNGVVATGGTIRFNDSELTVVIQDNSTVATIATQLSNIDGITATAVGNRIYIYSTGDTSDSDDSSKSAAVKFTDVSGTVTATLGIGGVWYYPPALQMTTHTQVPSWKRGDSFQGTVMTAGRPTGSVWIKTTEPNGGARIRVSRWNTGTKVWEATPAPIYETAASALYSLDRTGGGLNIATNVLFAQSNSNENTGYDVSPAQADFKIFRRSSTGATVIISTGSIATTGSFTISEYVRSSGTMSTPVTVTVDAATVDAVATAINSKGLAHVKADVSAQGELIISHATGGEIKFVDVDGGIVGGLFTAGVNNFYQAPTGAGADAFVASNWQALSYATFVASGTEPLSEPVDGQLWYNPEFSEVDIMIHDGDTWVGYNNVHASAEIIVAASQPVLTTGQGNINNHIWISTADLENFPTMYRWDSDAKAWNLIDKADQTSEDGVLFADARYGSSGETGDVAAPIADLLESDFLDPDAPDPALYPKGMLLWNTRRSGGNVKRYSNGHINTAQDNVRFGDEAMTDYATDRWVTASANQEDGSGTFGRKAQHQVVVAALKSAVDTSQEIRDEERRNFNLIACPVYPELLSNLINLNLDRGVTAFVVGDVPFRLASDATTLTNWGTNANGALDNNETGIVSYDEYSAVFYPTGFTTDLSGTNAVVPSSHMMLRTIALSDQVSYPWFAPAGTRRGGITNATAVGYIDALTGEFQSVALNEGQRDTLYDLKVNPIPFFVGVGLVAYGQKTRARNASALDRINVARLVVYLRSQLSKLARPYIFEPNDKITRDEIRGAVESLLLELVGLRALYDFAVVCDESNNTASRIDRNELYVDIAIEPTKAVEFIYIPLRIKNTGEI